MISISEILNLFGLRDCVHCGEQAGSHDLPLCAGCRSVLPANLISCAPTPSISHLFRMADYSGPMGSLIRRGKYRPDLLLFQALSRRLGQASQMLKAPDAVVHIPSASRRIMSRGFDQSLLLARQVARTLNAPCLSLFNRIDPGEQAGRTHFQRENPGRARFSLKCPSPPHVLLVDDVRTTGGTIDECARLLAAGGSAEICGVVLAAA